MTEILKFALSLLPVILFLIGLILLDSFKLVKLRNVLLTIAVGGAVAIAALGINTWLFSEFEFSRHFFSRYLAPAIEEALKAGFVIYLIRSNKVGFMIDGAIYGFAAGAGFALVENIYYLQALETTNLLIWLIRGLGTAVMHGGTIAIFAIISMNLLGRFGENAYWVFLPGLFIAIVIHSFFNHFLFSPEVMTLGQCILLPLLITIVFYQSEKNYQDWMNINLDTDIEMIDSIESGQFQGTRAGEYLLSLKTHFPGEKVADMLCLIRINLELSCQAKGLLLCRQAGLPVVIDDELEDKFEELKYLEKSLGFTGLLAISPMLKQSSRELWELYMLKQ